MSRILGIDYGSKRVGVALSSEDCAFALPHSTVQNSPKLADDIFAIAAQNDAKEVVMGDSTNYKGEANSIMESAGLFKRQLEDKGLVVHLEPEFMSSVQAGRWQGKTDKLDSSAAAIILQSFLDKTFAKNSSNEADNETKSEVSSE